MTAALELGLESTSEPSPGGAPAIAHFPRVVRHDLPRIAELLRDDWRDGLAREGLAPVAVTADADAEHVPCPACGTAAPLVEGACSDCGLQLEWGE